MSTRAKPNTKSSSHKNMVISRDYMYPYKTACGLSLESKIEIIALYESHAKSPASNVEQAVRIH